MNLYREKIVIPGGHVIRAKVYVMDVATKATTGGPLSTVIITVTVPPSQRARIPDSVPSLQWRGATFYRRGIIVPIVALGKVDHYEITAVSEDTPG